jgi:hypothetical protein
MAAKFVCLELLHRLDTGIGRHGGFLFDISAAFAFSVDVVS